MPRVQEIPTHLRFFARIDKFHMECPRCAKLILSQKRLRDATNYRQISGFNPLNGRLFCPSCGFGMGLGLLCYPLLLRAHAGSHRPPDQKPTWQELLQLRELSGGFYVGEAKAPLDHRNLYVEAECRCRPDDRVWGSPCPIHSPKGPVE